jgi:hypothetical protein
MSHSPTSRVSRVVTVLTVLLAWHFGCGAARATKDAAPFAEMLPVEP